MKNIDKQIFYEMLCAEYSTRLALAARVPCELHVQDLFLPNERFNAELFLKIEDHIEQTSRRLWVHPL